MCLLIYKPAGADLDHDMLEKAAKVNPDGWGLAAIMPDHLFVVKGLKWNNEMLSSTKQPIPELMHEFKDQEMIVHFRRQSSGIISLDNAHPIPIAGNTWLAHNGHITEFAGTRQDAKSDTAQFAAWLALTLEEVGPAMFDSDAFWMGLEALLTKRNKLAIIRPEGIRLINRKEGYELKDGVWVSNKNWEWPAQQQGNFTRLHPAMGGYIDKRRVCAICWDCGCKDCTDEGQKPCAGLSSPNPWHAVWCGLADSHARNCPGLRSYYPLGTEDYLCMKCHKQYPDIQTPAALRAYYVQLKGEQLLNDTPLLDPATEADRAEAEAAMRNNLSRVVDDDDDDWGCWNGLYHRRPYHDRH